MKATTLLLFIASICVIQSGLDGFREKSCSDFQFKTDEDHQAYSKDFCRTLGLRDSDNKCCYVKFQQNNGTFYGCYEVTLKEFYDIKTVRDDLKTRYGLKKIVCDSSSYLYGSLLLILVLLF